MDGRGHLINSSTSFCMTLTVWSSYFDGHLKIITLAAVVTEFRVLLMIVIVMKGPTRYPLPSVNAALMSTAPVSCPLKVIGKVPSVDGSLAMVASWNYRFNSQPPPSVLDLCNHSRVKQVLTKMCAH